jgi:amino acid transporter
VGGSSVWLGLLLLSPFLILTAYGFLNHAPSAAAPIPLHQVDFPLAIVVAMWNYMGWDNSSTVATEVDRPQRTYPLAMAGAVVLVSVTYVLPIGAVAFTGLDPNRWSTGGWADVARAVCGTTGAGAALAVAITVGGMIGAVGTLNALTMALSRLPAVLAEDGFLPKLFARRHPRTGAPWVAIIACAAAWALCLGLNFGKLVMLDVLLTGLSILLEFAALIVLRIREPKLHRPYRVPGGVPGTIALSLPPLALLILSVVRNKNEPLGPINALELGALLILAGFGTYFLSTRELRSER